jgi:CarboxypepD_reg-like domain
MNSNFQLNIPKPCSEQWDKFTTTPEGGLCGSCQKNVIDFTQMSESQLVAYFRDLPAKENKICGRFRNDQLEKNYRVNDWFPKWNIQNNQINYEVPVSRFLEKSSTISLPFISNMKVVRNVTMAVLTLVFAEQGFGQTRLLSGKVVDGTDGTPLIGASISIKGKNKVVTADRNGYYQIQIDAKDILVVSCVGYDRTEIESKRVKKIEKILLKATILGDIEVVTVGEVDNFYDPNPDNRFDINRFTTEISIQNQTKEEVVLNPKLSHNAHFYDNSLKERIEKWYTENGFQEVKDVEIYDQSGKVFKSNFRVVNDGKVWVNIRHIPSGDYFIRMKLVNERSQVEEETAVTQFSIRK